MAKNSMTTDTATIQPYLDHHGRVAAALPGGELPWLAGLRETGLSRFSRQGFPTARVEAWRYTSLRPLEKVAFEPASAAGGAVSIDVLPTVMPAGRRRTAWCSSTARSARTSPPSERCRRGPS